MYTVLQWLHYQLFLHPIIFLLSLLFAMFVYHKLFKTTTQGKNLPPSPPKLPIIGNFHQLGSSLHRSFLSLSQQYGKIMLLHLGSKPALVVSSVDSVQEIMKTNDMIFANRPQSLVVRRIFYDGKDVAFARYGEYWRKMKSICVMELLNNSKVQSFRSIREEEVGLMVEKIRNSCSSVVNLSEIIITYTNDVICRAAFGRKYNCESEGSIDFAELLREVMNLLLSFCCGDFIPWLSWVDRVTGLNARVEKVAKELDQFLEMVVQEHQHHLSMKKDDYDDKPKEQKKVKNFVDILLEYNRDNKDAFSTNSIKAITLDIFIAGTDTIYTLIEWTMSEVIRHPRVMNKLRDEVRQSVGGLSQRVNEDHLQKMTYLKAVIKEALRLHPPAPLLVFREPSQDVKVNGFDVSTKTQVIINAWAIHRDPIFWEQPEEFLPERFLDGNASQLEFKGQDLIYTPFGGGRRMCPGISFAMANAELVLATLVSEFDWNLPGGGDARMLDMAETFGMTVRRRDPLMVVPTPYSSI